MRTMVTFRDFWASDLGASLINKFASESRIGPGGGKKDPGFALTSIEVGSEIHSRILKAAAKCGIELEESFRVEHCEDEDFQDPMSPQYCRMVVKRLIEFDIDDVLMLEQACPAGESAAGCGLLKIMKNPYPINSSMIEYPICYDGFGQTIASESLVETIRNAGLTGLGASPTFDVAEGKTKYFRVQPVSVLSAVSLQTDLFYERAPCSHCTSKNLFFNGNLTFRREVFENIPDFNVTVESFGHGIIFPLWIVHHLVRDLIRNKLRQTDDFVTWHPIAFEK